MVEPGEPVELEDAAVLRIVAGCLLLRLLPGVFRPSLIALLSHWQLFNGLFPSLIRAFSWLRSHLLSAGCLRPQRALHFHYANTAVSHLRQICVVCD